MNEVRSRQTAAREPGSSWLHGSVKTAGSRHRETGIPCQDAALAALDLRPLAIVCDGRGSAELSHFGSAAAIRAFRKAVRVLEPLLAERLDNTSGEPATGKWARLSGILLRWFMHEQVELAVAHACDSHQFDFTVSAAVVGLHHTGWLQVGDSCLVVKRGEVLALAAKPQHGEFAGQTEFVSPDDRTTAVALHGLIPAEGIDGLMAFSDGVALKLVNAQTNEPARGVGQILDKLATAEWTNERLQAYLENPAWLAGGDDDRSIAYLVRPGRTNVMAHGEGEPTAKASPAATGTVDLSFRSESQKLNAGGKILPEPQGVTGPPKSKPDRARRRKRKHR